VSDVRYELRPTVDSVALNELFARAWAGHTSRDFSNLLTHSLACVCAYSGESLVGFVNVAWDGGSHAFLLDPTVDPEYQRQGIGRASIGAHLILES